MASAAIVYTKTQCTRCQPKRSARTSPLCDHHDPGSAARLASVRTEMILLLRERCGEDSQPPSTAHTYPYSLTKDVTLSHRARVALGYGKHHSRLDEIHPPYLLPATGGITAAYQTPRPFETSKPTLVLVNSFVTSSELFRPQFEDQKLTNAVNLIAIDPLGHGYTRTKAEQWTFWDTAIMNFEVLTALGIRGKVFVLGVGQGGCVTARMALLAPRKIAGIIPIGTSMDAENERTRKLGCWNAHETLTPLINGLMSAIPTPKFHPPQHFVTKEIENSFGQDVAEEVRKKWTHEITSHYAGDGGRRRLRMAAVNLRDRDSLHGRVFDVLCPVLWLHGTKDDVYGVENAKEEIELFANSPSAHFQAIAGGRHFSSWTHSEEVHEAIIDFVGKHGNLAAMLRVDG